MIFTFNFFFVDGDSASITIATAIIFFRFENIPTVQDLAMTGSLSVRGEVFTIGELPKKIESAAKVGINGRNHPKKQYARCDFRFSICQQD